MKFARLLAALALEVLEAWKKVENQVSFRHNDMRRSSACTARLVLIPWRYPFHCC